MTEQLIRAIDEVNDHFAITLDIMMFMKMTEDLRKFVAEQKVSVEQELQVGLEQKAKEFAEKGAEVYATA